MKRHTKLKRLLWSLGGAIVVLYGVNAGIIYFTQPITHQHGAVEEFSHEIGTNKIVALPDLKSGGIGALSVDALGYVNVTEAAPVIYVNSTYQKDLLTANDYLYKHEYAHILQKELIAAKAGGYPSYWNPIQSGIYYFYLLKLNADLEALMPPVREAEDLTILFSGLETGAECYAQPYSDKENPAVFQMPYLYPNFCTAEQKKIAIGMFTGSWPEPLSAEEKVTLKETSLIEAPEKSFSEIVKFAELAAEAGKFAGSIQREEPLEETPSPHR